MTETSTKEPDAEDIGSIFVVRTKAMFPGEPDVHQLAIWGGDSFMELEQDSGVDWVGPIKNVKDWWRWNGSWELGAIDNALADYAKGRDIHAIMRELKATRSELLGSTYSRE